MDRTLLSDRKYYPMADTPQGSSTAQVPQKAGAANLLQFVTSSPADPYPDIMQGFVRILQTARHYVYIETPYFLPTEPVLFALKSAAMAGVDVRIIVPRYSDARLTELASRSYLREVAEAGVQVFYYTTGFMHSKLLVCDDDISTCGSTNVDSRSFENNFESNVFFYGQPMALRMRDVFMRDMLESVAFDDVPERQHPPFLKRLTESVLRLFSPLM